MDAADPCQAPAARRVSGPAFRRVAFCGGSAIRIHQGQTQQLTRLPTFIKKVPSHASERVSKAVECQVEILQGCNDRHVEMLQPSRLLQEAPHALTEAVEEWKRNGRRKFQKLTSRCPARHQERRASQRAFPTFGALERCMLSRGGDTISMPRCSPQSLISLPRCIDCWPGWHAILSDQMMLPNCILVHVARASTDLGQG